MKFVIIAAALLAVNALWFMLARRRNRREYQARLNASLKKYVNSERNEWTGADDK